VAVSILSDEAVDTVARLAESEQAYQGFRPTVYFHQLNRPPVGDVLTAIRRIEDAYGSHEPIIEVVLGDWV
jgi:hypothetical protein